MTPCARVREMTNDDGLGHGDACAKFLVILRNRIVYALGESR